MQQTITNKLKQLTLVFGLAAATLAIQLVIAPGAHATTYNVNTVSNPTGCGFLEALAEINATPIPGATCAAASAPNTINVAAGTYTLPSSLPPLTTDGDLTITGDNASNTIINGNNFTGFILDPPSDGNNYSISNLTLEYFRQSAAELPQSVVTMAKGHFIGNRLIVRNNYCDVLSVGIPGCAIFASTGTATSSVSISNSVFYDNNAIQLIFINANPSSMMGDIINNTFYNNTGFIIQFANGSEEATLMGNVVNNTFYNNNFNSDALPFPLPPGLSSAILFNPAAFGGIYGSLNIKNNIFSHNTIDGSTPANCQDPSTLGTNSIITSQGGNISDDNTCAPVFTGTNDKNSTNPLLGTFSEVKNTWVLPLLANSPAIDNGIAGGLTPSTDQRGVTRPQGSAPDSGAYEYVYPTPGLPSTGAHLASTGSNTNIPVVITSLLVVAGIGTAGYSLKRK